MSRELDRDINAMRKIDAALRQSSSPRVLRATLEYFWRRYMIDPDARANVESIFAEREMRRVTSSQVGDP